MLNIPSEVKALFSSDIVHKNFHVHFPDSEYRDLNNEDVITESVQFTESLCSQQYFKFGLAEASQIEFTAVAIPNIKGAYIECAIEIDCTRLGAEWAEDNPVDNTLPFLEPQTCEYDSRIYYRVPYGRFRVDECPRDHGAMFQRQITAYSENVHSNEQMSPFEAYKLDMFLGNNSVLKQNMMRMIYSNIAYFQPEILTRSGYTQTQVKAWTGNYDLYSTPVFECTGGIQLKFEFAREGKSVSDSDGLDKLYRLDIGEYDFAAFEEMVDYLDSHYTVRTPYDPSIRNNLKSYHYYPEARFYHSPRAPWYNDQGIPAFDISNGIPCFYPYRASKGTLYLQIQLFDTVKVTEIKNGVSTVLFDLDFGSGITTAAIYEWIPPTTTVLDDIVMQFEPTAKKKMESTLSGKTYKYKGFSYSNVYEYTKIMEGFLELCGWFLKPSRDGTLDFFQMSENPSSIQIPAEDWSEFWWDETPIQSIGRVNVIYTKDNVEQQGTFVIGDGNSVYTIEDNDVLTNVDVDDEMLQDLLDTYFAPNASTVNFTPVDLEMRALPYLESGDYVQLTAEDGEMVETYILSQTIKGIQHLEASITSTNGELLEVIDDE